MLFVAVGCSFSGCLSEQELAQWRERAQMEKDFNSIKRRLDSKKTADWRSAVEMLRDWAKQEGTEKQRLALDMMVRHGEKNGTGAGVCLRRVHPYLSYREELYFDYWEDDFVALEGNPRLKTGRYTEHTLNGIRRWEGFSKCKRLWMGGGNSPKRNALRSLLKELAGTGSPQCERAYCHLLEPWTLVNFQDQWCAYDDEEDVLREALQLARKNANGSVFLLARIAYYGNLPVNIYSLWGFNNDGRTPASRALISECTSVFFEKYLKKGNVEAICEITRAGRSVDDWYYSSKDYVVILRDLALKGNETALSALKSLALAKLNSDNIGTAGKAVDALIFLQEKRPTEDVRQTLLSVKRNTTDNAIYDRIDKKIK